MLWQAVFGACCRWPTVRPSRTAFPIPSLPSRLIFSKTPRLPGGWRFRLRVEAADDARIGDGIRSPVTNLAIFLDRLGHYEAAAITAGFAFSPLMAASFPNLSTAIGHLREVLGESKYESLASRGAVMTTAAMATYAHAQIDQARAELE